MEGVVRRNNRREGGRSEEDEVQPARLAADGEREGLPSRLAAPAPDLAPTGARVVSLEAVDDQAPGAGPASGARSAEGLAPQEPQDCSHLAGGLAGQRHGAGIFHGSQAWGHNVRLGQHFWKHRET